MSTLTPSILRWANLTTQQANELTGRLTERERDVAWCLALGMSPAMTAKVLNMSPKTFEQHRRSVYKHRFQLPSPEAIPIVMFLSAGGLVWPAQYNVEAPTVPHFGADQNDDSKEK